MIEIDNIISEQLDLVRKKINKGHFETLCDFNLKELSVLKEKAEGLRGKKGIYLFEICNKDAVVFDEWISDFTPKFRGKENEYLHKWTPNIVKKRTSEHKGNIIRWIPFYLGKSKDIAKRLDTHINSRLGKPPQGLKLKERGNLDSQLFRVKYMDLDYIVNYDVIVVEIEKKLRDEINPIVGK